MIGDFANRQQSGPEQLRYRNVDAVDQQLVEAWTASSALAAMTSCIRLATLATSVAWRNPAHLAKTVVCVSASYQQR
jgi:alkanesulfonate monooxygenase SsuD/methylene tetrahydromethanopterin reductase-like flavin-dependent oxidoreductase (luciferase family)